MNAPTWTRGIADRRDQIDVGSTAQRVVRLLRSQVLDGQLRPGMQLTEEPLVSALGVSRNTVREALALLASERLLEHRRHRGMFVRRLDREELADLCGLRRSLEVGALREAAALPRVDPDRPRAVIEAARAGRAAADTGDWDAAGTANSALHLALAALAGNARLDESVAAVMAEMRLAFVVLAEPQRIHEPFVPRNEHLADLVAAGSLTEAVDELDRYLREAQARLVEAYLQVAPADGA